MNPSIEQAAGEAGSDALGALLRVALNDDGTLQGPAVQSALGGSLPVVTGAGVSLQLVKTVVGEPGTSTATNTLGLRILTSDPATPTTLYAGDSSTGLWKSTDDGSTWTKIYTTTNVQVMRCLVLSTGTILIVTKDSTPVYHLWRSTDGGTTFTKELDFNSASLGILGSQSWVEDTTTTPKRIYAAEYAPTNQASVNLYKSTDDGATWSAVYTFAQGVVRHFHGVFIDPYVMSRVWVTVGDTGTQPRIGYSDDGGVTFTWITQGVYPDSRAVGLLFDANYVYWVPDTPDQRAGVYRYDRTSHQVSSLDVGSRTFMTAFYWAVQHGGMFAYIGSAEGGTAGWNGDGYVYFLAGNAANWRHVARWYGTSGVDAVPIGITSPDANGAFWVCIQNLADTSNFNNMINLKLQLEAAPAIDAQPADWHREVLSSYRDDAISYTLAGSFSATQQVMIMPAPFDLIVTGGSFGVTSALAADGVNYWTVRVDRFAAGAYVRTLLQSTSSAVAWAANAVRAVDTDNSPQLVKKGDALMFRVEKTAGTPSNIVNPTVTLNIRRSVSPTR